MLYNSYIYLGDDVTYIWAHCIRYYKINHDPRVLQSLTVDFFSYRLFSRFSCLAAPEAAHLELSRTLGKTGMFYLKLLINFLSLLIAGQIDWHALGKFIGSTGPALKPGISPDRSDLLCVRRIDMFLRRQCLKG